MSEVELTGVEEVLDVDGVGVGEVGDLGSGVEVEVDGQLRIIQGEVMNMPVNALKLHPQNPRKGDLAALGKSIDRFGFYGRVLVQKSTGFILAGNHRYKSLLEKNASFVPVEVLDVDDETALGIVLADNRISDLAGYDDGMLTGLLMEMGEYEGGFEGTGYEEEDLEGLLAGLGNLDPGGAGGLGGGVVTPEPKRGSLIDEFVVPPFSVLDSRQSYWQKRKRSWLDLGIDGSKGRDAPCLQHNMTAAGGYKGYGVFASTSVFDPVLCELVYRWFCLDGGSVLDPFAGELTKGAVASVLGLEYTGVELRQEQVDENARQYEILRQEHIEKKEGVVDDLDDVDNMLGKGISKSPVPRWLCGDSHKIDQLLPDGVMYDLVFTSPPYYDLEIYSESEKDGSAFETYEGFMQWYREIFVQSVSRLKENRFLVVKIGDVRDKRGSYYNFLGDNIDCFARHCGLSYVNECVLLTPVVTLPLRAGRAFRAGRKLGKAHQNVLVFFKGDPRDIGEVFGKNIGFGNPQDFPHMFEEALVEGEGNDE